MVTQVQILGLDCNDYVIKWQDLNMVHCYDSRWKGKTCPKEVAVQSKFEKNPSENRQVTLVYTI